MIVNDKEALNRLNNPMNLINRLRDSRSSKTDAMALFGLGRKDGSITRTERTEEKSTSLTVKEQQTSARIPAARVFDGSVHGDSFRSQNGTSVAEDETESEQKTSRIPSIDNLLNNGESQIKLTLAHDNALELLNRSVEYLSAKLDDVKADKLPAVISAASKTVESIRRERSEASKNNKDREVHYHFYTPLQKKVEDYEVIEVA